MSKERKYDVIVQLTDGFHDIFDIKAKSEIEATMLAWDHIDENFEGGELYSIGESWA